MWWPFKKEKTLLESEIFHGMTDWHSHILPGADDGISNMDDALKVLTRYEQLGITEVWLTPHIMEDCPNETDNLRSCFAELQERYLEKKRSSEVMPVTLHLSGEYMLDALFRERLKNNDLLTYGQDGKRLLIETSCTKGPADMDDLIANIIKAGYKPVLAHPERYLYMHRPDYNKLSDMGVEFQMNILSLASMYGPEPLRKAKILLDRGYYSRVGTDIHGYSKFAIAINEYNIERKYLDKIKEIIDSTP